MTNELSDSNVSEKTAFATSHKWADEMDFILPLGNACRPARQLQTAGVRTFSAPLDWMMRYPLDLAVDLIARGFEGFFSSPEEDAEKGKGKNNRYVIDKATGMVSMHGFPWTKSLEEELPAFYEKMLRRGRRLKEKILKADKIGIIMNRNEKEETILAFIRKLSSAFPQQQFYVLNLFDDKTLSENQRLRRIIAETESYSVCEIRLNDTHENGDDPKKNPNFWLGNVPAWQEILKQEFSLKKDEDSQIKVSVIIPCYNVEKYLRECLDSVVNQTLKEIEIICVDDGSTDSTPQILEEYAAKDSRFTILHQKNQFAGVARNNGMKIARGKYLCFLDSDDVFDLKMLEKAFKRAEKYAAEIVLWGAYVFKNTLSDAVQEPGVLNFSKIPPKNVFSADECCSEIFQLGWGVPWNKLFLTSFVRKNHLKFQKLRTSNDIFFVYSALVSAQKISALKEALLYYRRTPKSGSLQESFQKTPTDFIFAQKALSVFLDSRKLSSFRGSFSQMCLGNMESYIRRLQERTGSSEEILKTLREYGGLSYFGITDDQVRERPQWVILLYFRIRTLVEKRPVVSVIIPVYNAERFLRKTLTLIETQTLKELEVICVDDGSTDSSLKILQEYAEKDLRFSIISQKNKGPGKARNTAILQAKGMYIGTVDSDDKIDRDFYQKLAVEAFKCDAKIAKAQIKVISFDGSEKIPSPNQQIRARKGRLYASFTSGHVSAIYNRDFILSNRIFYGEQFSRGEDTIFLMNLTLRTEEIALVDSVNYYYILRQDSLTHTQTKDYFDDKLNVTNYLIDLLNTRKDYDKSYYHYLRGRFSYLVKVISPQWQTCGFPQRIIQNLEQKLIALYEKIHDGPEKQLILEGLPILKKLISEKSKTTDCLSSKKKLKHRESSVSPLLVRLASLFIFSKSKRKAFRAKHLNLVPRDGIDVNLRGRVKSDSALKRFGVRVVSLFIFSKKKRKAFRARHMDLTPKNGVDVNALSPEERRLRKQKKRERDPLRRLFNAVVPASRSKVAHTEKRIIRHMEWQTQQILSAIKGAQAQSERRFNELKQEIARAQKGLSTNIKTELAQVRERADVVSREQLARMDAQKKFFAERAEMLSRELDGLSSALTAGLSLQTAAVSNLASAQKALRASVIESYAALEKCKPNSLEFRTFGDLAHCIRTNLHKLPADADLVVGVPRSGMIPAYTIALFMNKRCCSLDEFLSDTEISTGARPVGAMSIRKVLVVDDSCFSGSALARTKERLKAVAGKYEFVFAAVYGRTESADKLDCCLELVDGRRVWQWNYLNHSLAGSACFDMDGVLCADPTPEENDDGAKYLNFIKNAKPLYIPSYKIRAIVTSRLEKYREPTETWLREHGVQYDELVMLNMATAEERRRANCHAAFKAEAYKARERTTLFVESEERQAKEIAFLSGKDVLCVATDKLY